MSAVEQGVGTVPVSSAAQVGGRLQETVDVGRVVFNLPLHEPYWYFLPRDRAFGSLFSNPAGTQYSVLAQAPVPNPLRIGTRKGTITHLDELQAYEKRAGDASLKITLSDLLLQVVDDNNSLAAWECPPQGNCDPVRTVVRFHARAYAASAGDAAGGDFFNAGGVAYLEGHQHSWRPGAATSSDSPKALWGEQDFGVDGDADDSGTGAAGVMYLNKPRSVNVPLASVRTGELFAVDVTLEAEAVDDRGGESAAQAFIQDPQKREPLLFTTRGLAPRGKPRFKAPPVRPLQPAHCGSSRPRGAGVLALSDPTYTANESERAPMVLVTRTGGSRGEASVTLTAHSGTAQAGRDFKATTTTVRFGDGDTSPRLVEVPLREDTLSEGAEMFSVDLGHARCAALGARHRAAVTIIDDEVEPPTSPPPAAFAIGGTVDGLQGSGLVITDAGLDVPVSANGRFTFPGTFAAGAPYTVDVRTQPHGPDQFCTVQNGRGTVASADVSNIAVHCATPPPPSGLDTTFGSGGRVSTPVGGGEGQAVVIQPDGGIVTAGFHTVGAGEDFALTRHDAAGNLDTDFGTGGIASTDLGGNRDEAFDAALLPDGGVVAVGRTNAAGGLNTDFGVVRYGPGGTLDGITKTDIANGGDQANAVAVQPDGKIVVAGFTTHGGKSDFALVRYDARGTLDDSFGTHGIATIDMGSFDDDARAIAIQPDGKIVVAGSRTNDVVLARFTTGGQLDGTFGTAGKTISNFSTDAADGIALMPSGEIEIAGTEFGTRDFDFQLARFDDHGTLEKTVKTDIGSGDDFAENLVVDSQGRTIVVGRATSSTILDMALVRYRADGTLDTSFDGDGIVTADLHARGEFGQDVAIDSAGRIVAAGYTANGGDTQFALLRANP